MTFINVVILQIFPFQEFSLKGELQEKSITVSGHNEISLEEKKTIFSCHLMILAFSLSPVNGITGAYFGLKAFSIRSMKNTCDLNKWASPFINEFWTSSSFSLIHLTSSGSQISFKKKY